MEAITITLTPHEVETLREALSCAISEEYRDGWEQRFYDVLAKLEPQDATEQAEHVVRCSVCGDGYKQPVTVTAYTCHDCQQAQQ